MDVDERPDEPKPERRIDAFRRTHLANERTYLAWWRTGLTAVAVGIAAGGIVPKLVDTEKWGFAAIGIGFAVLGVVLLAYGLRRELNVSKAIASGSFAPPDTRMLLFLTGAAVALGVLTVVVLIVSL